MNDRVGGSRTAEERTVWIVSPYYPPFPRVGATKRIATFARHLPAFGFRPVVLTMDWGTDGSSRERVYRTRNLASYSWKAYQSADLRAGSSALQSAMRAFIGCLRWIKTYLLVPDELVLWSMSAAAAGRRIAAREAPCLILVTAPPYSSLLTAVILKKLYQLPLVCDIRDDWGGNPLIEKRSSLLRRIEDAMERWVVRNADAVVVMTAESKDLWCRRHPGRADRFVLIPNGYSEDEFSAAAPRDYGHVSLVHVGSMEAGRSPALILRAMKRLQRQGADVHFHQVGLALSEFREQVMQCGLDDSVHFDGMVTSEEAVSCMLGASLLVLLPTQTAPTAIPGKAYEYLRAGRPILLISEENATTLFMRQFSSVHYVEPDDEEGCARIIAAAAADDLKASAAGPGIAQYERRSLTGRLAELMRSICGRAA